MKVRTEIEKYADEADKDILLGIVICCIMS